MFGCAGVRACERACVQASERGCVCARSQMLHRAAAGQQRSLAFRIGRAGPRRAEPTGPDHLYVCIVLRCAACAVLRCVHCCASTSSLDNASRHPGTHGRRGEGGVQAHAPSRRTMKRYKDKDKFQLQVFNCFSCPYLFMIWRGGRTGARPVEGRAN